MGKKKRNEGEKREEQGVPVIGISRHRMGMDGKGVTTLVAMHGCMLRCKYCINHRCFGPEKGLRRYTPEELYAELMKDDLYFRATGGGVTFGGGEPLLRADFIARFRQICGAKWKINVETSLNVPTSLVKQLVEVVDEWIVDVKTDLPGAYLRYTGQEMRQAFDNLRFLREEAGVNPERILIRIPVITGFTSREDAESTRQRLENEGFTRFDLFTYRTGEKETHDDEKEEIADSNTLPGKAICKILREIRREIAAQMGCGELPPDDCTLEGNCPGTCPRCEYELNLLSRFMRENGKTELKISDELARRIEEMWQNTIEDASQSNDAEIMPENGEIENFPIYGEMQEPPREVYKKVFFKECAVAGLSFHIKGNDEVWDELEEGTHIALVRQRDNRYDRNAVAVALADDYDGDPDDFDFDFILGYLPRTDNAEIAAMMDAGYADKFSAEITTYNRHGSYDNRIRITIYLESREPVVIRPDLLRMHWLDDDAFAKMVKQLKEVGFATFRWGGFPLDEHSLPEEGDKIVMIHQEESGSYRIFLMHVLMKDDNCEKLGLDRDEIIAVDDRLHFALTLAAAPQIVDADLLRAIGIADPACCSVDDYLSEHADEYLKMRFGIDSAISRHEA